MSDKDRHIPTVFISSTNIDLEAYRKEAVMAANAADMVADLQENWTAEDHPPLDRCLERVRKADVLVVIVAHRYGWVPEDQEHNPEGKSITWLECEVAKANGRHVLAFVVDEGVDWPRELREETELDRAMEEEDDEKAAKLMEEARQRIKKLKTFKNRINLWGLRRTFKTTVELKLEVERALKAWRTQPADGIEQRRQDEATIQQSISDDESRFRFEDIADASDPRHGNTPTYIGSFTKCLPHDSDGFLHDPADYDNWVLAIDSGDPRDFRRLRVGPGPFTADGGFQYSDPLNANSQPVHNWAHAYPADEEPGVRAWESQGAGGSTYDPEGPDAQAVSMPPCPSLDSQELIAEMAEVYWMAVCRDIPFADWEGHASISAARESLKRLWWFRADRTDRLDGATDRLPASLARRRILSEDGIAPVPFAQLFRGVTPDEQLGPYISQFLLIGNAGIADAQAITDGQIVYGANRANRRVRVATDDSYMQTWDEWLDVQNGADVRGRETYNPGYRLISRPRDLATYVHHDALYEAYLNACLILLGLGAPFDRGLPFQRADYKDKQQGFAQFGGPHILTLVREVATRALKAVRYQKFNVHRRLRPEAVGGWMYQRRNGNNTIRDRLAVLANMEAAFAGSSQVGNAVETVNRNTPDNWLLPMAFPEGSPTHPSYGADHATVAGACVTILKAWFDHGWELKSGGSRIVFEADANGTVLNNVSGSYPDDSLTIEGELNKLAGNISIGRNWAGVNYYSDYIESIWIGEQVALRLLREQKDTFGENFSVTVPLFDGNKVRISHIPHPS